MASAAALSRARRLFSVSYSSTPRAKPSKPATSPAPVATPEAPAGEGGSGAGQKARKPMRKVLQSIFREQDPDKLVLDFVAASAAFPRFRDRHRVYEVAVSRLASLGRRDAVTAIIDAQKAFLEDADEGFAARLVRLYGRASMPSHAAATFRDLPPHHKSVNTFNALLAACADAGDVEALAAALQEIPANHPTVVPSVYSYNILISALCQKLQLPAALDVIPLMEKCGLAPDMISFNTLLNGYYYNGHLDDAEKVWQMMKERNVEPDTKSYNAKLIGLVAQGRVEDAAAVIEKMEKDGPKPDTVSYNEMIRGYCKDGRLGEAKKVHDELVRNGFVLKKGAFETLMPRLLEAGELDLALKLCHEIFSRKCGVDPVVLQELVSALVAASRVEEATKIAELGKKINHPRSGKGPLNLRIQQNNDAEAETNSKDSALCEESSEEETECANA